jgi:hypothetical protein
MAGTYYVLVVSQGQNQTNGNCNGPGSGWGTGSASYTLSSWSEPVTTCSQSLELWQRFAHHQCAGGRGDEVLPVQRAGGHREHRGAIGEPGGQSHDVCCREHTVVVPGWGRLDGLLRMMITPTYGGHKLSVVGWKPDHHPQSTTYGTYSLSALCLQG